MKILKIVVTLLSFSVIGTGIAFYLYANKKFGTAYNSYSAKLSAPGTTEEWEVLSIRDGDTIKVKKNGVIENIRLCGIDAPEISQPLGKESRDYLRSVFSLKKMVQISTVGTDRYNRKIGEVFLINSDGTEKFLNEELVKAGMAYVYHQYSKNCPNEISLKNGEAMAQSKKIGVWSRNYQKPWEYRKAKRSK
ncbi:thermonuclease family protein (plasmid) [Anabaena sp. PCC 7938]|uniref:Nuclease (SNase domain-containing protein) n=1 Tax=Anabaena cylindrica (strain ATCC 27899 / PCC 7122) TaxID=272123 RepID=K9ZSG0_ANACC|nr:MULTISPECIES: thermonuclease family protein [Anabaena]AFZ61300.1 nuclease (SNase domain-containing protein) [Anabaena cylindrica PCC 7122]AZL96597.1 SNase domain-containing protein [Anabaena sp. CCAP 1446/1C]MCM2410091.1 thermonuclease family protein [Anabaena sp. CCAP 1446/1C]BAY06831.1 nuclease [Anabaena cylindrica PCC 7122]